MKIKRIKDGKDVKAGNYIRAYVSCNGRMDVDYVVLKGKPFTDKKGMFKGSLLIKGGANKTNSYKPEDWYFSTLSDDLNENFTEKRKQVVGKVLIKFTPSTYKHLKSLSKRFILSDFFDAINGRVLTNSELETELDRITHYNEFRKTMPF